MPPRFDGHRITIKLIYIYIFGIVKGLFPLVEVNYFYLDLLKDKVLLHTLNIIKINNIYFNLIYFIFNVTLKMIVTLMKKTHITPVIRVILQWFYNGCRSQRCNISISYYTGVVTIVGICSDLAGNSSVKGFATSNSIFHLLNRNKCKNAPSSPPELQANLRNTPNGASSDRLHSDTQVSLAKPPKN